jgi:hypothetical protein
MKLLDAYDLRARVAPAYLVFAPLIVFVVAFAIGSAAWWSKAGGLAIACGGPLLAAQWGRSGGRRKEPELWASWGGSPTLQLLRYSAGGDQGSINRRHETVTQATGVALPDLEEELADPASADSTYNDAVAVLRELTRDRRAFRLVWEENANYGFRRNLWGRKALGVSLAAIVGLGSLGLLVADSVGPGWGSSAAAALSAGFSIFALIVWGLMVTQNWVKEVAEAYASRLIESAARLPVRH